MLMGSADDLPEAPTEKTVFVEDMPVEDQAALAAARNPGGLTNLGNTCYLNSTLQVNQPTKAKLIVRSNPNLKHSYSDLRHSYSKLNARTLTINAGTLSLNARTQT